MSLVLNVLKKIEQNFETVDLITEKIFHNKKLRRLKLNMKHLLSLIVCCIIVATIINLFWISSCESFVDGEGFAWVS